MQTARIQITDDDRVEVVEATRTRVYGGGVNRVALVAGRREVALRRDAGRWVAIETAPGPHGHRIHRIGVSRPLELSGERISVRVRRADQSE